MLEEKINHSIELLRKGEKLAISLDKEGYFVAFSGGKDSQVLLDLVKRAGVKYRAYYSVTSNDPPENVYFIRDVYPEVEFLRPEKNYYRLIAENGLPTRQRRFCCRVMKESFGVGKVVLTGVRREESVTRAVYEEFDIVSRRVENVGRKKTMEQVEKNEHQCIRGKDKIMLRPMLEWTEKDVWTYIYTYGLPVNPCYSLVGRVGCMFCPFSSKANIALYEKRYPLFKKLVVKSLKRYLVLYEKRGNELQLKDAEEYYDWWKSKKSIALYKQLRDSRLF